jgi:hypothetical protein
MPLSLPVSQADLAQARIRKDGQAKPLSNDPGRLARAQQVAAEDAVKTFIWF